MEKRVLLAIFLSFLVLYVYQSLVVKPTPKPVAAKTTTTTTAAPLATQPAAAAAPQPAENPTTATPLVGDTREQDIRIETRDVIAVFTNRGARLKSWRLKHYLDPHREPLDLVVSEAATEPLPLSLQVDDDAITRTLNSALYTVAGAPASGTVASSPVDLRFEYRDSSGVHAVKEFHIEPANYIVRLHAVVSAQPYSVVWGPAVGDAGAELSRFTQRPEALLSIGGKAQRLSPSDLAKQATYEAGFDYAGVDDQYFMTTALKPGSARFTYGVFSIPPPAGSKDAPREYVSYSVRRAANDDRPFEFFAGPKDFDVLASIDREYVRAINFGMFAFLVVPLLRSLKWINGFVGNYGWSIVLLTVIVNAIMFPLRHKSVVSMRKMQEIQPEVKAIQDRYAKIKATDPAKQKMNQELMALYKERGVNPASGCVPMLLTFPVLLAFYSLLQTAIELRGAPFFGWIHDLSLHDPWYIIPILTGASQLWQQLITPAAGADPAQRRTMMIMPAVFTFMFLWAPAGVGLYWLVSNLWGIGQQYLTNYLIGPPVVRTVRPAAERRIKKVGSGKTEAAGGES